MKNEKFFRLISLMTCIIFILFVSQAASSEIQKTNNRNQTVITKVLKTMEFIYYLCFFIIYDFDFVVKNKKIDSRSDRPNLMPNVAVEASSNTPKSKD